MARGSGNRYESVSGLADRRDVPSTSSFNNASCRSRSKLSTHRQIDLPVTSASRSAPIDTCRAAASLATISMPMVRGFWVPLSTFDKCFSLSLALRQLADAQPQRFPQLVGSLVVEWEHGIATNYAYRRTLAAYWTHRIHRSYHPHDPHGRGPGGLLGSDATIWLAPSDTRPRVRGKTERPRCTPRAIQCTG